jgi:hypothetical protein
LTTSLSKSTGLSGKRLISAAEAIREFIQGLDADLFQKTIYYGGNLADMMRDTGLYKDTMKKRKRKRD